MVENRSTLLVYPNIPHPDLKTQAEPTPISEYFLNKKDGRQTLQGLSLQKENFVTIRAAQEVSENCQQAVNRNVQEISERRLTGDFLVEIPVWDKKNKLKYLVKEGDLTLSGENIQCNIQMM